MNTDKLDDTKLFMLLRDIRDLNYPPESLSDPDNLEKQLSGTLDVGTQEALALLGYLISRGFVKIEPNIGLFINPASKYVQAIIQSGGLDNVPSSRSYARNELGPDKDGRGGRVTH